MFCLTKFKHTHKTITYTASFNGERTSTTVEPFTTPDINSKL